MSKIAKNRKTQRRMSRFGGGVQAGIVTLFEGRHKKARGGAMDDYEVAKSRKTQRKMSLNEGRGIGNTE